MLLILGRGHVRYERVKAGTCEHEHALFSFCSYRQCFDLEGESGIVVRGIGTAATLTKCYETQVSPSTEKAE